MLENIDNTPNRFLQIVEPYYSRIRAETHKLLKQCEEGFEHSRDDHDCSVYTGAGGRNFIYLFIARTYVVFFSLTAK